MKASFLSRVSGTATTSLLNTRTLAILALVGANLIWGGSAAASKPVLERIPPITTASIRVAIALVLLSVILRHRHVRVATGTAPVLLGLTGVALFCACQNLGLRVVDATTTSLIGAAIPILTVGFAALLIGERLSVRRAVGIAVSMLGVGIIMLPGSGEPVDAIVAASLLPLASTASFAAYNVLGRRAFGQGNAIAIVAGSTRYGLIFLLPCTVVELIQEDIGQVTMPDTLLLLYLGAGCSAVAFLLCGHGLTHIEASHGAVFGNIKPLVGVAFSVVLLGEPLSLLQVLGGLLVVAGVGIACHHQQKAGGRAGRRTMDAPLITPALVRSWSSTTILKTNTRVGEDLVSFRSARREDTRSSPTGNYFENRSNAR
jgi:drug/metabolite transporter (DMT)-like permease